MSERVITLGGQQFVIAPIDLGTLKKIGVGSARAQKPSTDPAEREANWYTGTFEVIAAALGYFDEKGLPDSKKVEAITDVTFPQVLEAVRVVYELTGLVSKKEAGKPKAGEGEGAQAGTTG